jgi:NAD(P)H-dependent FMN reductase
MPVALQVLLIGGSLRAGSTNAAVLATAVADAPDGVEASIYEGLATLPHFNPIVDLPLRRQVADAFAALVDHVSTTTAR